MGLPTRPRAEWPSDPPGLSFLSVLLDEQHLAIGGERPRLVRHRELEFVARFTQRRHRRDPDVAEVLRVLFCGAIALVAERLFELVAAPREPIDPLPQPVEQPLALHRPAAG